MIVEFYKIPGLLIILDFLAYYEISIRYVSLNAATKVST